MDVRPPVWVGHITLKTDRLAESKAFMLAIGMRPIFKGAGVVVLELRGGTHLVLAETSDCQPVAAPFDLMVEDLDAAHAHFAAAGANPSPIKQGRIHRSFVVAEPAGNTVTFNDTHVSDQPV